MFRRIALSLVFVLILMFAISCSGGNGDLVTPPTGDRNVVAAEPGSTAFLGLWQFVADKATGNVDMVQLRSADKIINVLGFMEPPALTLMDLDWPALDIDFDGGTAEVGVILTHPIAGDPVFTGFDVRGVCFGPTVTNADGLTITPGPEFFSGVPFGYQDGLLGAPDSFGNYEGLAGYKYYCDGLAADGDLVTFFNDADNLADRGLFSAGETNQRDYLLDWNGTGYDILVFNYAIYANYDWPVGDPPITKDNFDITTANSAEAFCCNVVELNNGLYYAGTGGGGTISLQAEIWDWLGDITDVTIESLEPGIIAQTSYDAAIGAFPNGYSYGYEFYAVPGTPTTVGDLDILITVVDSKTFGEHWFLDLLETSHAMYDANIYNCFVHTATVIDCPPATVNSIDPDGCFGGQVAATIDGAFIDGTSLAVKLTMTGETDIVATNVVFVDSATVTCDIDMTGAATGDWTVVVTNGCGVEGELVDGFEVKSCATNNSCPTTLGGSTLYFGWTGSGYPYIDDSGGLEKARDTTAPYWFTVGQQQTGVYGQKFFAHNGWSATNVFTSAPIHGAYYWPTDFCVDSNDRIYYNGYYSNRVEYVDFDETTGFGTMDNNGGTITSGWSIWRMDVDEDDNIILLAYSGTSLRIFHWNGSTFDEINVDSTVMSDNYNQYRYAANGFAYNPVTGQYLITNAYGSYTSSCQGRLYVINPDGTIDADRSDMSIWTTSQPSGSSYFKVGIYVERDDPDCHIILTSGGRKSSYPYYYNRYARYNPVMGEKGTSFFESSSYSSLGLYYNGYGQGFVMDFGGTDYYMGYGYCCYYVRRVPLPTW